MSGRVFVIGIGPAGEAMMTAEAKDALAQASDVFGYAPYLARLAEISGQRRHPSDNRVERARAEQALALAAAGKPVALVSGGDAGVFGMAATVFEAMEAGDPAWRALDVAVIPGITAMLAASARLGAPLGHDFCALSLSDNLKPWALIEKRLRAAADADFVIALYNPISRARPWQLGAAFAILRETIPPETPVAFARAIGRADERITLFSLASADPARADMATLVIIGARASRLIARPGARPWFYTPRFAS